MNRHSNIRVVSVGILVALLSADQARGRPPGADPRWAREPASDCETSNTVVALSEAAAGILGLEYAQVEAAPLARTVERPVELAYNANRYARLSSRASGVVAEITRDLGEKVKKGDVLAVVDSTELGSAKSDLLLALESARLWAINAERERALVRQGAGVEREALEAETRAAEARIAVNRARQRLRNLGLSSEQVRTVEREDDTTSLLELLAPFDGTIVERSAVIGEVVEPGAPILSLADTTVMWALADLMEADIALVRAGQQAEVALDGLPDRTFGGAVEWISTQIDPRTRTLKARIELENPEGLLRAGMFGRAVIRAGESRSAITVPKDAVQWEGCCNIAFVRADALGREFRPVRLTLVHDAGERYEVSGGLGPGDVIVTRGSYILKNEILKDAVGAGCCEVGHLDK